MNIPGFGVGTLVAGADFSSKYGYAVKLVAGVLELCDTAGERALGIIGTAAVEGAPVDLKIDGVQECVAGAAITKGMRLTVNALGKVVEGRGADRCIGTALADASGANSYVSVLLEGANAFCDHAPYSTSIPITLAGVTAADVLTGLLPGHRGRIASVEFFITTVVTTGSKAATLGLEIDGTNVTGGAVALTSANCTPLGARVAGSAITAANLFEADDPIDIEASAVTAFSEGAGVLVIHFA